MQQSPEGTESECASDPIDRPPSVSSPMQVLKKNNAQKKSTKNTIYHPHILMLLVKCCEI